MARLRERRFLLPWIGSTLLMFGLSCLWHGVALNDLREVRTPLPLYFTLSALVYVLIGLGMTVVMHQAIAHDWIKIRHGFPLMGMLMGAIFGFVVFLIAFIFGMSFTDKQAIHIVVDVLWQMLEQGLGGLTISLGIIYDLHQNFLENERVH